MTKRSGDSALREAASRLAPETAQSMLAVSGALASSLDLDVVLQLAIEHTCSLLDLDTGAIYLLDGASLHLGATTPPLPPRFPYELRRALLSDHPQAAESLEHGKVVYWKDFHAAPLSENERAVCEQRNLHSIMFIPLLLKDEPVGVMIVGTTGERERAFDEEDVHLSWILAYQVALAVANAQLYGSLEAAHEEVRASNDNLERLVQERTEEIAQANEELQAQAEELQTQAKKLRVTAEELTLSNDARARFLRSMSHELRTPLNSIIGFTTMVLKGLAGDLNDEQRLQLTMVNNAGKHLLAIMNDMLDLCRIDAGAVKLNIESLDVPALVDECVTAVSLAAQAKGIALTAELPDPCPQLISDAVRVRQILLNLLDNAVKFTEAGTVTIAVSCPTDEVIAFAVRDTGPGISAEKLEAVFGEYEQALESRDRTVEGTGLGLAVSQGLAGTLGGTIEVESTLGEGSTFTLVLPITQDEAISEALQD